MVASGVDASPPSLRLLLFGPFEVWLEDRPLPRLRSRKSQWLLVLLALRNGAAVEREWLAGLLWPEHVDRQAMRNSLTELRRALGKEAERLRSPAAHTLSLDLSGAAVDLLAFDAAIARGDAPSLAEAVALYRGPFLEGCFEEWAFHERQIRDQAYLSARERLAADALAGGDAATAESHLRRAAAVDPLRESTQRALMEAMGASGNSAGALRVYRELRLRLLRELNAEPNPATRALFERLCEEARETAGARGEGQGARGKGNAAPTTLPAVTVAENRLMTVLFAGMSGSIRATKGLDAEEAAELENRLLTVMVEAILEFGGRVDRFLEFGVLALFGTPRAHEDDPERAIRAAIRIREDARRLGIDVAAGINTGEVYLGALGSERHREVTVAGPVVSLASWLQGRAEPGRILVGEGTYHQTRRAFDFSSLSLPIPDLAESMTVYAVAGALARPEKTRGIEGLRAALIGRDEELATLKAAVVAVIQGRGQMVCISGEAGVGKSRLVNELRSRLQASHTPSPELPLWLEGRCFELSAGTGYALFVDLFQGYFAWELGEEPRDPGERLVATLREFSDRGELTADRVEEIGPLLGRLLSARFGTGAPTAFWRGSDSGGEWDERLQNVSPEQIHYQTCRAVRDFLIALSRRRPILLVLEDLHWADSLSLNLISVLMEALPLAPIGLCCVYRFEPEHPCAHLATIAARSCPEQWREIRLRELTPGQSGELLDSLLPSEPMPGRVRERILQKSRGNPFFLEELVRSLIACRRVYHDGDRWRVREGGEAISAPESVRSLIQSRFDHLPPELQRALQSAAVIGSVFRPRLLETVLAGVGWPAEGEGRNPLLSPLLRELEAQGLVTKTRAAPEAEYSFRHGLTQETVYQRIPRRHRVEWHRRVAEAMEGLYQDGLPEHYESLAYHYERGDGGEKAVEYLLKAGEKARRAYLNEDAVGYFQRALDRCEDRGSRIEALRGLGEVSRGLGKHTEAEAHFRQAIASAHEMGLGPSALARLYFRLGETLIWQRRAPEMIDPAEEVLSLLGEQTESVENALMNEIAGMGYRWNRDREKSLEYLRRNARFLHRLPYSEELRSPYSSVLIMYSMEEDDVEAATRWARILEKKARQHHDPGALGEALTFRSGLLELRGDLRGGIAPNLQSLELFRKTGEVAQQYYACMRMRRIYLQMGQLPEAEAYASKQREAAEAMEDRRETAVSLVAVGAVALCQGRADAAMEAYRTAARVSGDDRFLLAWIAYASGRALLAQGNRSGARDQFQEAACLRVPEPPFLTDLLCALEEACDDPEAFLAFCHRLRTEHPDLHDTPLAQWRLEPSAPRDFGSRRAFSLQSEGWVWHDPLGDCSLTLPGGREIRAANGRDFCYPNRSAPRLLRPVSGDFVVQAVCRSAPGAGPAMGGLLLWKNTRHYLRLDWGVKGPHQLSFGGCLPEQPVPARIWVGEKDVILGRGRLVTERIYLRLERQGGWVRALCSADGRRWFTVGETPFAGDDALEVGVHAIGAIHRMIYPGAYPEGTAIRFESFDLWA